MRRLTIGVAAIMCMTASGCWAGEMRSEDASVRWRPGAIEFETRAMRQRLDTSGGGLRRVAWLNKRTGTDLLGRGPVGDFALTIDGERVSSADAGWGIGEPTCERLEHGELHLSVPLTRGGIDVTRHYLMHHGLSLVRGWLEVTNAGPKSVTVDDPPIVSLSCPADEVDLKWMSGAELFGDSWRMRTEPMTAEPRVFDSYDAPPSAGDAALQGDGTDARITLNGEQVWPEAGWAHSAHSADAQTHEVGVDVEPGDRIAFALGRGGNMTCDTTEWDPVIAYADGEVHRASDGFSTQQNEGGWSYEYLGDDGQVRALTYADVPGRYGQRWRLDVNVLEPFVSATEMHPDPRGCAERVFTAPRAGRVTISGSLRNTGNAALPGSGFRMGTQTYAPWFCLMDSQTGEAAYMGFDCMAHWRAEFSASDADIRLAGYSRDLAPGETIRTPYAFTGLFAGDLDDMGQEVLEWQYRCMWDYTREPWFPAVRMLGYWMKGTSWGAHGWVGGSPDMESAFRKVFRTADLMRSVGGDTYHRDWGWWDRAGDWNGPDFRATGEYLSKHDMGQLIYAFIYTVDGESGVAQAHPEWLANPNTLDQSMPEVVNYEVDLLHEFTERWGAFQWRNDSGPIAPRDGDDTVLLRQQQGFMEVLKRFQDAHPECAFQGVNGGGMALNWEYLGLSSGFQFTDGQSGALACYHATYLFPPDKINDMPDIWDPDKYDPATWRSLLCSNFDMTGDTFDPVKLEGLRDLIDVYHFLQTKGVVGRWVRVYHPVIEGDEETMYLQRLSWDRERGIIITRHLIQGTVTIRPKGLVDDAEYGVSFHESAETLTRTGAELMRDGIMLTDPAPGELVYLNLPDHPGNRLDRVPPMAPSAVRCAAGRNMGVPGVEIAWKPGEDDRWLSHYQVWRDGEMLGRAAKGCFYFDHSAGADPTAQYGIVAVDGSGNESPRVAAPPAGGARRTVIDDAELATIDYTGGWERQTDFAPAHGGTTSSAETAGASFVVRFTGRAVTWHSRLGAEGGLARVTVDDGEAETVCCYAADEIPGWPIFEYEWDQPGEHELHVEVLGESDPRGAGKRVWIDAVTVEP